MDASQIFAALRKGNFVMTPLANNQMRYEDLDFVFVKKSDYSPIPNETATRTHFEDLERADAMWIERTGWSRSADALAGQADMWKEDNIPPSLLTAHDTLMDEVIQMGESPATVSLWQNDLWRVRAQAENFTEEPVFVPVFKEKYLATFRKLFCVLVSRPKIFQFTANQRAAYDIMKKDPKTWTVLGFWHSVVCYSYSGCANAAYQPLEAGLAALNWDETNGMFRPLKQAMQIIAHIMLMIKLMLVYFSICASQLMLSVNHGGRNLTMGRFFERECQPFIRTKRSSEGHTPAGKILRLWAYGRAISETSTGNVQLSEDGNISIGAAATSESHIKSGIMRLVDDLESQAVALVGRNVSALDPRMFLDYMEVECTGTRVGESPADKKRLWDWAGGDPIVMMDRFWSKRIYNGGRLSRVQCERDFFVEVVRFKELLLVALQLTGGSPARCSEILTLRLMNSTWEKRNVEFGLGGGALAYRYKKQGAGVLKTVHRFLPQKVARSLLVYIAVIHPFIMCMNQLLSRPVGERALLQSRYLFQSQYRQRVLDELDDDDDDPPETSDTHEQECDAVIFDDMWTLDRVRTVLNVTMTKYFGTKAGVMNVSSWRNCQALITQKRIPDNDGIDFHVGADFHALQFGHGAETERRHDGIAPLDPEDRRICFQHASLAWHNYIGLDAAVRLS
ncbi:LOW QUALITY PROTEIN: hypothetical protein B0I72DRAFT_133157 [Yarrowia lipolytica]|uniref:Uncharacterized protein n=1 Tax=Yarrowia lipolytica TaxID=4952 RepID=A0A371C0A5_YARLL|nr:LOW QUALITY PROTEIN: hypothetical protein B0I71DRAFT_135409 [Yarrowia lipolytica]RDW35448.1 LOW QUALITY PROTEIN: hypothetical protein B0I72DRAFT_133157 [Yarrowia lipolytica]RDW38954.1 LOW QUALITY PROTEIN: hypothetical protein B0I73DRAFT_132891 [Yarrowia lipolytica]RDW44759.1 LOW QUALITY PROTEIN: hypothetical protein B0I74DRAFT_139913 [Yarrowia lipolytica]RDW51216.1 LOW QUALITY PROTEIN: hypothetical protein B0I75DRAFT_140271 [Yarrowia lipolytica]